MVLPSVNGTDYTVPQLARLSLALARLRQGRTLDRDMCELVLHIPPVVSNVVAKLRYHAIVSGFCRKAEHFDHTLYDMYASAWSQLKAWRR